MSPRKTTPQKSAPRQARGERTETTTLRAVADAFFAAEDWPVTWFADGAMCRGDFEGSNGRWELVLHAREADRQWIVYSACPLIVPAARMPAMGEFITRANFGLVLGCFELDWDDGELRFRTSLDLDETPPTPQLLRPLVFANALMLDLYLPGIAAVLGGAAPTDALAQCELQEVLNAE